MGGLLVLPRETQIADYIRVHDRGELPEAEQRPDRLDPVGPLRLKFSRFDRSTVPPPISWAGFWEAAVQISGENSRTRP